MPFLTSLANLILPGLFKTVEAVIPDKNLQDNLKAQLQAAFLQTDTAQVEQAASVVIAEAKGESWLQRNWRPLIMMEFGFIIAFNFVLGPVLRMFHLAVGDLPTPPDLWDLMKLGLGGYVVGRSVEKAIANWKGGA